MPAYIDWVYECRSDKYPKGITGKGGYAQPLPNGNILVCMGGANYIFEVTPGKEVVWQCSFQKWDNGNWTDFDNYRAISSSSLYPFAFSLQHAERTGKNLSLVLNNEGTEPDSYVIKVSDGKKTTSKNISVSQRSSQPVSIKLKKIFQEKI